MTISAGRRFGPYEITAPLGAGGMGEVWRARDTRLDRSVAIKVIPAELARDAQLRVRFEREARVISSLAHPHICTLFDIGHDDGIDYLVMELLEGETLAERIARGPLPLRDVIRYGIEIADALAAAHRTGIVHRDLKPGNVILTKNGAKLLDFGLATSAPVVAQADAATIQKSLTQPGMIVGTVQYMAPEQIEGAEADARTDIFALGAVLYEMATGQRAFVGKTRTSLFAAILSGEPRPMSELQPVTPPALERLVRTCLAKDPDERLQNAHDVAIELRWVDEGAQEPPTRTPLRSTRIAWATAAAALIALAFAAATMLTRTTETPPPVRFTIAHPTGFVAHRSAAISPDGTKVVFRADSVDSEMLFLRDLSSLESRPLGGTEGVTLVFWSPDSKNIGFVARDKLLRMDIASGSMRSIYEPVRASGGGTWNRDDVIVFSPVSEASLYRVSASGGEATPATRMKDGEQVHVWPHFLPDGKRYVFTAAGGSQGGIYAGSIDSDERKLLLPIRGIGDMTPTIFARGHLFYIRDGKLLAHPFDPDRLELHGTPRIVDDAVEINGPGRAPLGVAENGTIVYRRAGPVTVTHLRVVDAGGRELARIVEPGPYSNPRVSPDGRRILVAREDATSNIWIIDTARGTTTRATFDQFATAAVWAPDGASFAYAAANDSPPNVHFRRADGKTLRLTRAAEQHYPTSVSPDGRWVVFSRPGGRGGFDVAAVSITPPHEQIALRSTEFAESEGVVSPDGRWLAYTSNESGSNQVYVTAFPEAGARWQISIAGGERPRWSIDGRRLYFSDAEQMTISAVAIAADGAELRAGVPELVFGGDASAYEPAHDGRFIVAPRTINAGSPELTVLVNWIPGS